MAIIDRSLYGRIRDIVTNEVLDFYYMPDSISESVEPQWEEVTVIGRSSPIWGYSGTGAKTIGLELTFAATEDVKKDVIEKVQWLQSLKYPEYNGSVMFPPHRIHLIIGSFIHMEGILQSAGVTYSGPFEVNGPQGSTLYPMVAKVDVTVAEVVDRPYGYSSVRSSSTIGVYADEWADLSSNLDRASSFQPEEDYSDFLSSLEGD